MARPKIVWDDDEYRQFEALCGMLATVEEIENVLDVDHKTIDRLCKDRYGFGFSQAYKKYSDGGRLTLRRYQMQLAKKSAAMAIFLGKQYLGQKDVVEPAEKNDGILPDLLAFLKGGK